MCTHTACPRCGHQLRPETTPFISAVQKPKDEIPTAYEEIRQLDVTLQQLQRRRSLLLNKINTIQAATRVLPDEVLSHIFLYTYPPPKFRDGHDKHIAPLPPVLRLIAVCSEWRQVAASTSELWTTLPIDITHTTIHSYIPIVKTFVDNASPHPVSLQLNFRFYDHMMPRNEGRSPPIRSGSGVPLEPERTFLDHLHRYGTKIKVLQVDSMPRSWIGAIKWEHFGALTDLDIRCSKLARVHPNTSLSLPEGIQSVRLESLPDPISSTLQLPANNITVLELTYIPTSTCVRLLSQCPNLVKFSSTYPRLRRDRGEPTAHFTEDVVMAHLVELEWDCLDVAWGHIFLERFQFPALQKLTWRGQPSSFGDARITDFLQALPATIQKFDVAFYLLDRLPSEALQHILSFFPQITDLQVELVPMITGGHEAMMMTLAATFLGSLAAASYDLVSEAIVPLLKRLCLKIDLSKADMLRDFRRSVDLEILLSMLVLRRERGLEYFKLDWDRGVVLGQEDKRRIDYLVDEGMDIEMEVSEDIVGWDSDMVVLGHGEEE